MKTLACILLFVAGICNLFGQGTASSSGEPALNVNSALTNRPLDPGRYISSLDYQRRVNTFIPDEYKFQNSSFLNGYLFYSSGKRSPVMKMNYNTFLRAMYYIDHSRDTLQLFPTPDLKYIVTEQQLYYHDVLSGIYEVCAGRKEPVKLGKQKVFYQSEVHPMIGQKSYSENYSTDGALYIEYIPHDPKEAKQKILFLKEDRFVLIDETDYLELASKKGFFTMFSHFQDELKAFLKQQSKEHHSIDFHKEADLARFLAYCNTLVVK
jgi:hypothetical protein